MMKRHASFFRVLLRTFLYISVLMIFIVDAPAEGARGITQQQLVKGLSDAHAFVETKKYRSAAVLLEKILNTFPGNVEVLYLLGQAYEGAKLYSKAASYLRKASTLSSGVTQLQRDFSRVSYLSGDYEGAISVLEALQADDLNPAVRKSIANDLAKIKIYQAIDKSNLSQAINLAQSSILLFPNDIEFYSILGGIYSDVDLFEDAESALYVSREKAVDKSVVDLALSKLYEKNSKTDKQRTVLNRIMKENNEGSAYRYAVSTLMERAERNYENGEFDAALVDAQLILDYLPRQLGAGKLLSKIYVKKDKLGLARSNYVRLKEQYPKQVDIRVSLADLYFEMGEANKAALQFREVTKLVSSGEFYERSKDKLSQLRERKIDELSLSIISEGKFQSSLDAIEDWIADGDYGPAESYLKLLLVNNAESGRANFLLGKVYSMRSHEKLAKKYLTRAIFYSADEVDYYFYYAEYSERLGELSAAAQLYQNVIDISTNDSASNSAQKNIDFIRGEQLITQNKLGEALSVFRELMAANPTDKRVLLKTASVLNLLGESEEARKVTVSISEISRIDKSENELVNRAKEALNRGDSIAAMSILKSILDVTPNSSKANYWIGFHLVQQKKIPEATKYIEKSVQFSPANRKLKFYLAKIYTLNRELEKSEAIYNDLLISPENIAEKLEIERLSGLVAGRRYIKAGSYDRALSHFRGLAEKFPQNINVLEALSEIYSKQSNKKLLEKTYLEMIKSNPSYVSAYGRLSSLYLKNGNIGGWRENLRNVIKYDGFEGQLKRKAIGQLLGVANKYLLEKKLEKANVELVAVLSIVPDDADANLVKAEIYRLQGDFEKAEEIYLSVLSSNPFNHAARIKLAKFYIKEEKLDEAIAEYEKVQRVASSEVVVQEAAASLRNITKIKANNISLELSKDSNVDEILDAVKAWVQKREINTAHDVLIDLVELFPQNPQVNYWLGRVYDARSQFLLALSHINRSVELAPSNPRLRSEYGRVLVRAGEYEEAERQYGIVIKQGGNSAFTKETKKLLGFAIGQRYRSKSQLEEALAHYLEMYESFPNDPRVLAQLGSVNLQLRNFNTAEKIYRQILAIQPDNAAMHFQLATIYKEKGELDKFNKQLLQVIVLDPNGLGLRATNELGLSDGNRYLRQGKWLHAIKSFQRILKTDAKNIHAHLGISTALFESGEKKRAENLLLSILQEQPTSTKVRLELARLFVKTNRIQPALQELERIVFVEGDSPLGKKAKINLANIYRTKAELLGKRGDISGAVKEYMNTVRRDPKDIKAHLALAGIFQRNPRFIKNSIKHYNEALKIEPRNFQVLVNLGGVYERIRDYGSAMEIFSRAIAVADDKANQHMLRKLTLSVRMQVARIQYAEKNYSWVVNELLDMLTYDSRSSQINIFLSTVYTVQGKLDLAIVTLRKVLETSPNNWNVRYRLAVLYERTSEDELALAQYRTIVRANAAGNLVEQARDRLPALEDRVKSFNYSLTYSLSSSRIIFPRIQISSKSFNSSLRFNFTTRYRPTKDVNISFRISPAYSALHESQNDSLSPEYGVVGQYNTSGIVFTANASSRETRGLLLEDFRGGETNFSLSAAKRLDTPLIETGDDRSLPQTVQYQLRFRDFSSEGRSFFSTREVSPSVNFIYPLRTGGSVTASYSFTDSQNVDQFGSDYANYSYNMSVSIRALVAKKLSASFSSSIKRSIYKNNDSREQYLNGNLEKRRNWTVSLSAQFNYQFHRRLSVFSSISSTGNQSNLGSGYIYWVKDIPVGVQTSTLTDYRSLNISTGVSFKF